VRFGSGWSWLKIFPLWIAIMSGVLSIVRETYGMFVANPIDSKSIFWACARIAFILSAAIAWWQEHRAVRRFENATHTRTVVEEYRFQAAKTALEKHGDDAIKILRHLRTLGKMVFEMGGPILPSGIDSPRALQILRILKKEGIVESEEIPLTGSRGNKTLYRITSEMESAIDDLLRSHLQAYD
jgi:hypothetical protein